MKVKDPRRAGAAVGLYSGRRDCGPPDRARLGRAQSGACPGGGPGAGWPALPESCGRPRQGRPARRRW